MIKLVQLFFILTIACFTHTAVADENVRYFTKMPGVISPLLEFSPQGEIDLKQSRNYNHYQVHYDTKNRLSSIKYFNGTTPSTDSYFYTHEVRYTYMTGKKIREYFGVKGEVMAMERHYYRSSNVHREEYELNGSSTKLHLYDINGVRVAAGTGTFVFEGELIEGKGLIQRLYRENGTPSIIFDYLPFEVALLTLDENGFIHRILNFDEKLNKVIQHKAGGFAEMRIMFDQFGNELGWDFRDQAGNLVNRAADMVDGGHAKWTYEFQWTKREYGQYSSYIQRYFTADGEIFCKNKVICSEKYEFNSRENVILNEKRDRTEELVVDPDQGFAKFEIDYDEKGRRLIMRYYDASENLRKTQFATRKWSYKKDGTANEQSYNHLGVEINLSN
jgi:hypothetical protein